MMKTEVLGYNTIQNTMTSGSRPTQFHSPFQSNHRVTSPHSNGVPSPHPDSPPLSVPPSASASTSKAEPPKRLRYWLVDMIDSGEIPGLRWENPSRTVFRIPWKHAGKNNWKEEDSKIFKAWAEHRGKYREGDKIEAATWKTRLRCALNKLPDIKEMKDRSNLEGNEPYRVYQLLPEQDKFQENEIFPRNSCKKGSPVNQIHHSPISSEPNDYMEFHRHDINMTAENNRRMSPYAANGGVQPSCMAEQIQQPTDPAFQMGCLTIDNHNSPQQAVSYPSIQETRLTVEPPPATFFPEKSPSGKGYQQDAFNNQPVENLHPHQGLVSPNGSDAMSRQIETFDVPDYQQFGANEAPQTCFLQPPDGPPCPHEMEIYIRYRGSDVLASHVTEPTGCRVHYGDASLQLIAVAQHELPSNVFGSESLQQIGLVDCTPYAVCRRQIELTNHVLSNIKRGLVLYYDSEDGCFYIQRLCQSRAFFFGPESTGTTPEKLERNQKVKVFDYQKFWNQLRKYSETGGSLPEMELKVSFSQNWSIQTPIWKNLVTLSMIPRAAKYLLEKVGLHDQSDNFNHSLLGPSLDSNDFLAENVMDRSGRCVDDLITHILGVVGMDSDPPQPFRNLPDARMTTNFTSGFFQENIIRTPPLAMQEDVDMTRYVTRS